MDRRASAGEALNGLRLVEGDDDDGLARLRSAGMPDLEAFVAKFAAYWAAPTTGLRELLADDIRLVQPLSRPAIGLDAAARWFASTLRAIPDLRGEVDRWSGCGELLFIEFRLSGTIGRRWIEWPVVDRFRIGADDRAHERISYFDPLPLLAAGLRSPRGWLQLVRTRR